MTWELVASCVVVVWVGLLLRGYLLGEERPPYLDAPPGHSVPYDWETETETETDN